MSTAPRQCIRLYLLYTIETRKIIYTYIIYVNSSCKYMLNRKLERVLCYECLIYSELKKTHLLINHVFHSQSMFPSYFSRFYEDAIPRRNKRHLTPLKGNKMGYKSTWILTALFP